MRLLQAKIVAALFITFASLLLTTKAALAITSEVDPREVDENTPTVDVTISGLVPNHPYYTFETTNKVSFTSDSNGQLIITACGLDETLIKVSNCTNNNYFHPRDKEGGYKVIIYDGDTHNEAYRTAFVVHHYIPTMTFSPANPKPNDPLKITICNGRRPFTADRNVYDFDFKGTLPQGVTDPPDVTIPSGQPCTESNFQLRDPGDYKLNVRYNETDGYVLYQFLFTVSPDGGTVQTFKDPGRLSGAPGENPCTVGVAGECKTALGNIPTNAGAFVDKILSIAIGIAGGIALILMVIGAVRVLTSSGDQQKLAGGRDQLVAAIAGLLFLIFSVLILRFIGISLFGFQ